MTKFRFFAILFILAVSAAVFAEESAENSGWLRTWGSGGEYSTGNWISIDPDNNIVCCGHVAFPSDLNPHPIHIEHYHSGSFVTKFDNDGEFLWTRVIDTPMYFKTAVDNYGNIYVAGVYIWETDLDPSTNEFMTESPDGCDIFLLKLNPDGETVWIKTWITGSIKELKSIAVDYENNIFLAGTYSEDIDLDPDPGEEIHRYSLGFDSFLVKMNPDGELIDGYSWSNRGFFIISFISPEQSGDLLILGNFNAVTDFDPRDEVLECDTITGSTFLARYDSEMNPVWIRLWESHDGGTIIETGLAAGSDGNIYLCGDVNADLDPTSGTEVHTAENFRQISFLVGLDSGGEYRFGRSWKSDNYVLSTGCAASPNGNVHVSGYFSGTVDLDPGESKFLATCPDEVKDAYISTFSPDGDFLWAAVWGGEEYDGSMFTATDSNGAVYVTGFYASDIQFANGEKIFYFGENAIFLIKLLSDGSM